MVHATNTTLSQKHQPSCPVRALPTPAPAPGSTPLFPVSLDLPVLDISYKWNHTTCGLSCLASFTGHPGVEAHPIAASVRRHSFSWLSDIPSHDGPRCVVHLFRCSGCFHFVAVATTAAPSAVYALLSERCQFSRVCFPGGASLGHKVTVSEFPAHFTEEKTESLCKLAHDRVPFIHLFPA